MEISSGGGNTRLPYLSWEKPEWGSRSNRIRYGTVDWFQTGKGVQWSVILSPYLLNFYVGYTSEVLGWMNYKLEWVKEKSEKGSLKLNIKKKLRSWHMVPSLYGKQKEKKRKKWQIFFPWAPESLQMVTVAMKFKTLASWKESYATIQSEISQKEKHQHSILTHIYGI